jgi:hypothetical protein
MKQIVFLFFTLCGICTVQAQDALLDTAAKTVAVKDTVKTKRVATVKLLNNPVKNKASLEVNGFDAGQVQVIVSDINGYRLRDDRRLLVGSIDIITIMFSLPAGIYIITVKQKDKAISKKMIVR